MTERVSLPAAAVFPTWPPARPIERPLPIGRPPHEQPIWLLHSPRLDYRALFAACLDQPLVPTTWLNAAERLQHASQVASAASCAQADWRSTNGRPPLPFAAWLERCVFAAGGVEALQSYAMPHVQPTWRCSWQVRGSAQRRPHQSLHPEAVQAAWEAMERLCTGPACYEDELSGTVMRALAACHHVADVEGLARCATLMTAQGTLSLRLVGLTAPSAQNGPSPATADASADGFALVAPSKPLATAPNAQLAPGTVPAPVEAPRLRRRLFGPPALVRAGWRKT